MTTSRRPPHAPELDFGWLVAALESFAVLEQGRADVARIHAVAREVVAACRESRERVLAAEQILDQFGDVVPASQKNELLRLMAETLLYIRFNGRRVKVTDDPRRILGAST